MASSNTRIVKQTVVVGRPKGFPDHDKGEKEIVAYTPPLEKPFEFTADELKQIEKANPAAVSTKAEEVDVADMKTPAGNEETKTAKKPEL